jgi:hypothetical protein
MLERGLELLELCRRDIRVVRRHHLRRISASHRKHLAVQSLSIGQTEVHQKRANIAAPT